MNNSSKLTNGSFVFSGCSQSSDSDTEKVFKTLSYSILALLSLVGNSLVINTVYRNKNLRSTTHRLIVNMAVSDLLLPVFAVPRQISEIWRQSWLIDGVLGNALCKLVPFFQDISGAVSVLSLVIIAVDRLFLVVFPTKKSIFTLQRTTISILATWIISSALYASYFYNSRLTTHDGTLYCMYNWEPAFENKTASKIHFTIPFVFLLVTPLGLLVVIYSIIVRVMQQRQNSSHLSEDNKKQQQKRNRKIMIMLISVVTVFFLSWSPVSVFGFLFYFVWDFQRECNLNTIVFVLVFLSFSYSAITLFIYYIFNENYRKGFNDILFCKFLKHGASPPSKKIVSQRKTFSVEEKSNGGEEGSSHSVELIGLRTINIPDLQEEQLRIPWRGHPIHSLI